MIKNSIQSWDGHSRKEIEEYIKSRLESAASEVAERFNELLKDAPQSLDTLKEIADKIDTLYTKPETGIPATDLAEGVIPTISTDITTDGDSDTKTASPKAVKTYVDESIPAALSAIESEIEAVGRGEYVTAWDGASTPVVADIPAGVSVTYNTTSYTGELAASDSTMGKIYLVSTGTTDEYDRYVTVRSGSVDSYTYSWSSIGSTSIQLSDYAPKAEVSQLGQDINTNKTNITNLQQEIDEIQPIVIEGNVTNAPDEEDITTDANDLLKFADRPTAVNQMGYVIMRKNKTFAEQVTETNTIYEIRYDFNLGAANVTIPEGCTLSFNGGRITNGRLLLSNNVTILDGVLSDVGVQVVRGATIINSTITRNSVINNIAYCVLVESSSLQNGDTLVVNGCRIENHCPAPSSTSGLEAVYGLAIKIISGVEYHFIIENNYLYSSCSMTIETQGDGDISGRLENNTVIADGSLYGMSVSFPDNYGDKLIANNYLKGGYVEVSPYCRVENNTIICTDVEGIEKKAIQCTGTSYSQDKTLMIVGNTIHGIVFLESINCSFALLNNTIYGLIHALKNVNGDRNLVCGNSILHTEDLPLASNTYAITMNTNGVTITDNNIQTFKNLYVPRYSIFSNNTVHFTAKMGFFLGARAIVCNNKIIWDIAHDYYSSYYIIFRFNGNISNCRVTDNTIIYNNLADVIAARKPIYEQNPVDSGMTDENKKTHFFENNVIIGYNSLTRGTTAERPVLSYYYGKSKYYDTTLGEEIFWYYDGVTRSWKTCTGEKAVLKKGATADRPTLVAADSGFTFFDTTLGKMIVWNGSAWVNMDGSALS